MNVMIKGYDIKGTKLFIILRDHTFISSFEINIGLGCFNVWVHNIEPSTRLLCFNTLQSISLLLGSYGLNPIEVNSLLGMYSKSNNLDWFSAPMDNLYEVDPSKGSDIIEIKEAIYDEVLILKTDSPLIGLVYITPTIQNNKQVYKIQINKTRESSIATVFTYTLDEVINLLHCFNFPVKFTETVVSNWWKAITTTFYGRQ